MALKIDSLRGSAPYVCQMTNNSTDEEPKKITGYLSQPIDISVSAQWQDAMNLNIPAIGDAVMQGVMGVSLVSPVGSYQIWQGTSPIEITLNLIYLAVNNTKKEVIEPSKTLLKWCLPSNKAGQMIVFEPPVKPLKSGITLETNYLSIPDLVITQVSFNPINSFNKGLPIKADVTVSLKTRRAIAGYELEAWFKEKPSRSVAALSEAADKAAEKSSSTALSSAIPALSSLLTPAAPVSPPSIPAGTP